MSKFDIANEMNSIMDGPKFQSVFTKPLTKTAAKKSDDKDKAKADKEKEMAKNAKACVAEAKKIMKKHKCKGTAKAEDGGCVVTLKGDKKDCAAAKKEIAAFCKSKKCKCKCTVEKTASDYEICVRGLAKISELLDKQGFEKEATEALLTLDSLVTRAAPTGELGSNTSGVNDCGPKGSMSDMGSAKDSDDKKDDDKDDKKDDDKDDKKDDDKKDLPPFMKKKDDKDDKDDDKKDDDESDAKGPKKDDEDDKKSDKEEDDKDDKKDDDKDEKDDDKDKSDASDQNNAGWEDAGEGDPMDPTLDVRIPVGKGADDEVAFDDMIAEIEGEGNPAGEGPNLSELAGEGEGMFEDEDLRALMDSIDLPEEEVVDPQDDPEEAAMGVEEDDPLAALEAASKKSSLEKLAGELKKNFLK